MKVVIKRDEVSPELWHKICTEVDMPTDVEQLCIKCEQVSACRYIERSNDGQSQRPLD